MSFLPGLFPGFIAGGVASVPNDFWEVAYSWDFSIDGATTPDATGLDIYQDLQIQCIGLDFNVNAFNIIQFLNAGVLDTGSNCDVYNANGTRNSTSTVFAIPNSTIATVPLTYNVLVFNTNLPVPHIFWSSNTIDPQRRIYTNPLPIDGIRFGSSPSATRTAGVIKVMGRRIPA